MTTKTEAASEVRKILQSVKDRLSEPGGSKVNEATTRAHFITPLLGAIGYHSIDDILFEVYLPDGKTFLDYRLVVDGKPRASIEAKALEVSLADQHAAQAVQYASLLGDQWAVVTNAREWRLYETFAQVPLADKHILTVDLVGWESDAQFDGVFEQLWLCSREAFSAGDGPATWLTRKKLESLLRSALTDPGSPEIKYIRRRLQDRDVPATAEQIVSWLKSRLDQAGSAAEPAPKPEGHGSAYAPAVAKPGKVRRRQHYTETVKDLIESGLLAPGQELLTTTPGRTERATALASGAIRFGGSDFDTLSAAAKAVTGNISEPGWDFWAIEEDGRRVTFFMLRERLRTRRPGYPA